MNNRSVEHLIIKAKALSDGKPLTLEELNSAENKLNIKLPQDFMDINLGCSYEFIYFTSGLSFPLGVVSETLTWRKNINLPNNYMVLSDDGTSAVLMKIDGNKSNVIWCCLEDVLGICNGGAMIYDPEIFPSFTDFYSFLLDEEEKIRAADAALKD
jgi:hypothetical protein